MKNDHRFDMSIEGVSLVKVHQVTTEEMGNLQFFESNRDIPFDIKRIYYITDVPSEIWRGGHAHKKLKQLIFCPYGRVRVELTNTKAKKVVILDRPDIGILIEKPVWRDLFWEVENSVLCVAASDYYLVEDYIRNYSDYEKYMEEHQ